jgi:hypothetical protein
VELLKEVRNRWWSFVSVSSRDFLQTKLTLPAASQDLGTVKPDLEVREVLVLVLQLAEIVPGFEE